MYSKTITLFNRVHTRENDTWIPTVITGVDLNVDEAAIRAVYGANAKDKAKLHIRYSPGIVIAGKTYQEPKVWAADHAGITFQTGDNFDFFWEGTWNGGTASDSDYTDGFYNFMRKTQDNVFAITSVARFVVIPHFEILGA